MGWGKKNTAKKSRAFRVITAGYLDGRVFFSSDRTSSGLSLLLFSLLWGCKNVRPFHGHPLQLQLALDEPPIPLIPLQSVYIHSHLLVSQALLTDVPITHIPIVSPTHLDSPALVADVSLVGVDHPHHLCFR